MSAMVQTGHRRIGTRAAQAPGWWLNREAAFSWLALGLLLGAWNAVDDAAAASERPQTLRGYDAVSVRAIHRAHVEP